MCVDLFARPWYNRESEGGMASGRKKKEKTMTTQTSNSRYTPAMEDMIVAAAPLNQASAQDLAELFFGDREQFRSVSAKAIRMGVAYERKQPTSKTGGPVERKEAIVADIVDLVGADLDGLEKASKLALQRIRSALAA